MNILILGATGSVGKSLTKYFLKKGHQVVVPYRNEQKKAEFLEFLNSKGVSQDENLLLIEGDLHSDEGAEKLFTAITLQNVHVDLIIAAVGKFEKTGRLIEVSTEKWHDILEANLTSHFRAAKHSILLLEEQNGGRYISINGDKSIYTETGYGAVSVSDAGHQMLIQALISENEMDGILIQSLTIMDPVNLDGESAGTIPADKIGERIENQLLTSSDDSNWDFKISSKDY